MMRWRSIENLPFEPRLGDGLLVRGISWLPTKRGAPLVWRLFWPREVIVVGAGRSCNDPYRIFFKSGATTMQSWWSIYASRVAVRVGPEDVTFYFQSCEEDLLSATLASGLLSRQQLCDDSPHAFWI